MPRGNEKYKYSTLKECGGLKENYFVSYAVQCSCGIPDNWTKKDAKKDTTEKPCNTGPFWGRTC